MTQPRYFLRGTSNPAAQVAAPVIGLHYQGATASGDHRFNINCAQWMTLSYAQKVARVTPFRPWHPAGAVKALDDMCARRTGSLRGVRPAGQALPDNVTFNVSGGYTDPTTGAQYDANGNLVGSTSTSPSSSSAGGGGGGGGGMSAASQTSLFNTVGGALNTTGATIASIVASNNQVDIARLQSQTQEAIASLNVQAQQAQQQGNVALAGIRAQQAAQLAQFNGQLLMQMQPQNTGLYIVAGIVALGIVGGIIYMVRSKQ